MQWQGIWGEMGCRRGEIDGDKIIANYELRITNVEAKIKTRFKEIITRYLLKSRFNLRFYIRNSQFVIRNYSFKVLLKTRQPCIRYRHHHIFQTF